MSCPSVNVFSYNVFSYQAQLGQSAIAILLLQISEKEMNSFCVVDMEKNQTILQPPPATAKSSDK